jgi:hypothetical protein
MMKISEILIELSRNCQLLGASRTGAQFTPVNEHRKRRRNNANGNLWATLLSILLSLPCPGFSTGETILCRESIPIEEDSEFARILLEKVKMSHEDLKFSYEYVFADAEVLRWLSKMATDYEDLLDSGLSIDEVPIPFNLVLSQKYYIYNRGSLPERIVRRMKINFVLKHIEKFSVDKQVRFLIFCKEMVENVPLIGSTFEMRVKMYLENKVRS